MMEEYWSMIISNAGYAKSRLMSWIVFAILLIKCLKIWEKKK